ncbi:MAG: ribonuclease HII [Candidatus Vogelbacteria bacterium]|nr:ribonuclease HII [Candidatus Vogelbacteria bacterium]
MLIPKSVKYVVGVDEVGRGPLAGPVTVAAVCVSLKVWQKLPRVRDSKQLSLMNRQKWKRELLTQKNKGKLWCARASISNTKIDEIGIVRAVRRAIALTLTKLDLPPRECLVLLDGSLYAPANYPHQKTIIRGDASETIIALASIWAKVHRDAYLAHLAKTYPQYGFEVHKGYGTALHYQALRRLGLTPIHRRSFLKKLA